MKLLVYGTLKRGYSNHVILGDSELLGITTITSDLYLVDLGPFPAAIPGPDMYNIIGEVYEIDDETLARCDRLEGYPYFYNRSRVETEFGEAWIYHFSSSDKHSPDEHITQWTRKRRA